ncbi:MAG: RNA polymerase sigma factor [Pseudomonadota bacterium]
MSRPRRAVVGIALEAEGASAAPDDASGPGLAAVVREAQAGNREAVRRFLEVVAPLARQTCRGVLGADHPDLEDVMQECLFASVKALASYRFEGEIGGYVTKIALRLAIAARRRTAARWRSHQSVDTGEIPDIPVSEPPPESVSVTRILEDLTPPQSEALFMRIVLGCSIQEIAAKMGVSPNAIKSRLRVGKNVLRHGRGPRGFWKRLFSERT